MGKKEGSYQHIHSMLWRGLEHSILKKTDKSLGSKNLILHRTGVSTSEVEYRRLRKTDKKRCSSNMIINRTWAIILE